MTVLAAPQAPAASKDRLRLWLKLLKTSRDIEGTVRRRLREAHATTLPRFDVLSALDRRPEGLKMSELSGLLRVSNGNVTGIVERLTEEGLALREAVAGDRRAQRVRITPAGRSAFERLAAEHEAWIDALFAGLSADEVAALSALLDRLSAGLEGGAP